MTDPGELTAFQVEVAGIFFALPQSEGFVVAGGAGLLASDLIVRPTQDLDLFASAPVSSVAEARDAFLAVLAGRGLSVKVVRDADTFVRMVVGRQGGEVVLVDLAVDSPPVLPLTVTVLGPTLAPAELAGRKLLALFDRAAARDFADVYVLSQRFGREALVAAARDLDAGFDLVVLAQMLGTIARFSDDEIPLPADVVPARPGVLRGLEPGPPLIAGPCRRKASAAVDDRSTDRPHHARSASHARGRYTRCCRLSTRSGLTAREVAGSGRIAAGTQRTKRVSRPPPPMSRSTWPRDPTRGRGEWPAEKPLASHLIRPAACNNLSQQPDHQRAVMDGFGPR